jgi:hypothetical protein
VTSGALSPSSCISLLRKNSPESASIRSHRLSLFLATVAFTVTVLGALLTFGVTRNVNFSLAPVVPDAESIPIIVRAASVKRVFMFLTLTNASGTPFAVARVAFRIG